jgi:phospholipid/cholesterol/gamma-HCH transport system substrate-binding protein
MERNKNDVWVGLFVLIGAAALVFLALQAANLLTLSFQPTYRRDAQVRQHRRPEAARRR